MANPLPGWQILLGVVDFLDARERVDFAQRLVVANTENAREAQGEAAIMPVRSHDVVERDLENDQRLDRPDAAPVLERVLNVLTADTLLKTWHGHRRLTRRAAALPRERASFQLFQHHFSVNA